MSSRRTFGADEAGRGPILGPMVVAVVGLDRSAAISLSRRGVGDSKRFGAGLKARQRRAELAAVIRERAPLHTMRIASARVVDEFTFRGELNVLERKLVHEMLQELGADTKDRIICDGANMFRPMRARYPQLEARDKGESFHVAVAAASILAKDARDRAFSQISSRYAAEFGPLAGGGYLNQATRRFLAAYKAQYGDLPQETRRSWGTRSVDPSSAHALKHRVPD